MFNRLFGKEKQVQPSRGNLGGDKNTAKTMEDMDAAIELLEKREAALEKRIEGELTKAKQLYAKKNTQGALQCMKRKKMYEEQLVNIGAQKQNLETLKFTVQNQSMNHEVLRAQIRAKEELKRSNKKMNADKIEDNMDDLMEEMDKANQVSEALRQPLDTNLVDEDELMNELEMELDGMNLGEVPAVDTKLPEMPAVPNQKLPAKPVKTKTQEDEDALAALEAELA
ncbi:snf7-like protein, putative [Leishmania panamensis]|uniref:Snf7-like protein, putative n=1 Tax=Leishmania panamensis TaxID=5679 RepID=A0A088S4H4_LEIPA|nr:snf7-like protein, putative [Leishmania panamensis]AIO02530.1 snf7-like protein, putative [Leishmania panamensis]